MTSDLKSEIEGLSHEDLMEITQSSLRRLLTSDALLQDLPSDVTTDEVLAQIAVAQGQSITVTLTRNDESPIRIVIPQQTATVADLKKAVRRAFSLRQKRLRSKTKISWRYVWKSYDLQCSTQVLRDNAELVANYGVRNKSEITFIKRLQNKNTPLDRIHHA